MKWTSAKIGVLMISAVMSMSSLLMGQDRENRPWVVYRGGEGPGQGKNIVFVTGDEEYRSEESMPMLAKILATRHGFRCTVLFAINKDSGEIDSLTLDNIPGLRTLERADLMVLFTRFRELPDEQMKYIMDYTNSGKPIIALRTATHPFFYQKNKENPYAKWSWNNPGAGTGAEPAFKGGYGRQVLGETWVSHYGDHQKESTLAYPAEGMEGSPILKGADKIWGPSDVYGLTTLNGDCKPVLMGQPLLGMNPTDAPNTNKKPLPVAWTKTYTGESGKPAKIFTTTMGHAGDLKDENFRRVLVNACYWAVGLEDQIPAKADVTILGDYNPNNIGFGGFKKGLKPADHRLPRN
ncbi:MAG: ThuA domain-containing protein [Phycisphaerales bacterium]